MEVSTICNGRCWGFWKSMPPVSDEEIQSIPTIAVGDIVEPGPNWNELKLGLKFRIITESKVRNNSSNQQDHQAQLLLRGRVVEVKAVWSYGGADVAVSWDDNDNSNNNNNNTHPDVVQGDDEKKEENGNISTEKNGPNSKKYYPSIYRWGILATNGQRMYDLQHVLTVNTSTTTND